MEAGEGGAPCGEKENRRSRKLKKSDQAHQADALDTPPDAGYAALATTAQASEDESSEDEARVLVQEQRPFCAAGPDCSIVEAEHYVTYRHTALNRKERREMEERKVAVQEAEPATALMKERRASGRWMELFGRRKNTLDKDKDKDKDKPKRREKDEQAQGDHRDQDAREEEGEMKEGSLVAATSAQQPTEASPTKGKDGQGSSQSGFTLKKIFGGKKGDASEATSAEEAGSTPVFSSTSPPKLSLLPSPMLSLAPAVDPSESPHFTTSLDSPGNMTPQEPPSDDGAQAQANEQQLAGVSYMTKKRTGVIEKVAEVKKKLQESSMSGVGEEVATEEQVAERLASFKKMVEELDMLEKELEQVLAMGDSFHVWQSQKRRLVEITPQGQVVSCDLLYRSPFVNDWGPITQQFNFKGSLLSSGPTYSFCKVKMVTKDGRQVDNLQDASVDDLLYEVKLANAIRYIDEIKSFGTADKSTPRKGAENVAGGMSFKIEWKSGTREQWHAEDGEGFERVLSYHMRAYSLRRSKQVGRLRGLWCLACTPYDSADKQHEEELMALWQVVCPDTLLTDRVTPQWKQIGFQGNDPATDFRGMGLLGLTTILYFARHHGDTLSALLKQGRSYPWASTGINLTQMLFKSLKLDEALIRAADSSERWDTPLFHFMTTKDNEEERNLFEEVFCQCFLLFDRIWVGSNAGYMDFPVVLNKVSQVFEEILLQRPKDIADLHRRQQVAVELPSKPQS